MTLKKLIETHRLYCNSHLDCGECEIAKKTELEGAYSCRDLILVNPRVLIETIENWYKENEPWSIKNL